VMPPVVLGCTDQSAANYNAWATQDDNSCSYPAPVVLGCTDQVATNYSASATENDGSCQYPAEQTSVAPDTTPPADSGDSEVTASAN
jgi:hypothetical protein